MTQWARARASTRRAPTSRTPTWWAWWSGGTFEPEFADLREAQEGDGCPQCGKPLAVKQGIEVGNIFKLGTKYSAPLGATVLDESGAERPIIMGSYGIGPARLAAAAVEQHSDERGIVWPKSIAPFDVHLVQVQVKDETQTSVASALHDRLGARAGRCCGTTGTRGPVSSSQTPNS